MKGSMIGSKFVGLLSCEMFWEGAFLTPFATSNVDAATLNEMARKAPAARIGFKRVPGEIGIHEAK
jgi:hypothetical protein